MPDSPNRDYVEQGILSPTNVWLIFAPQSSFKSVVAMNVARHLAEGTKVFGRFRVPKPLKVLYLDKEIGQDWFKFRINSMFGGEQERIPDNLYVVPKGFKALDIALENYKTLSPLIDVIDQIKPDILVLDCLNPFLSAPESEEAFKGVEKSIQKINEHFPDIGFVLIHHMREITREMDPLSIYNSRSSTKLTDWAATRMPMAIAPTKKADGPVKARIRTQMFLRHGPVMSFDFYVMPDFTIQGQPPKGKNLLEGI